MTRLERSIKLRLSRRDYRGAIPLIARALREAPDDHFLLMKRVLCEHELRHYAAGLRWGMRAMAAKPECPVVTYGVANSLHMLGRDDEAFGLLLPLTTCSHAELQRRCPDMTDSARGLQLDTWYLLFRVAIYRDKRFSAGQPYLQRHLELRRRGVRCLWSLRTVQKEVADYRREFPG